MREILAAQPSISDLEISYVTDAIANGWGRHCYDYLNRFKDCLKAYFDSKYVWPVSSCHGALHIILKALGVKSGDEVIVPDATWTGTVFPITWLGAKPVFVDVLKDSWCIDPEKIRQAITRKTKAIIPVHLYGNLCEMDEIMAIGRAEGIPVIEDAAEAIGSEYRGKKAGSIGDFGVFSFHGTKTMSTGEGGAIISNNGEMERIITTIESQGRIPGAKTFWVDEVGLKYKMSNMQAAMGLAQFQRADELVGKKREIFAWYRRALDRVEDISLNFEPNYVKNSFWMPTIVLGGRWKISSEKLVDCLNCRKIAARPFFYPVSSLPMYDDCRDNIVCRELHHRGINLPSYHSLEEGDIRYVVDVLLDSLE